MKVLCGLLLILGLVTLSYGVITLQLLGSNAVYLPYRYTPAPQYRYNAGVAEKSAYDGRRNEFILYSVGASTLHPIDFSNPNRQVVLEHIDFANGELTDVATCGAYVAVSMDNTANPELGKVWMFRAYNRQTQRMELLREINVGALPDQLIFTRSCEYLLVAIEGELRRIPGTNRVVDPEGGVQVIHFSGGRLDRPPTSNRFADFRAFNPLEQQLVQSGVRRVYRGQGAGFTTSLSQDLEPEYIAISSDQRTAYAVCQEANAIAVVDIAAARVREIRALGFDLWQGGNKVLDPSDRDGGINFDTWPVYRMFQPDTIKIINILGRDYLVTANEGDEKEYEPPRYPLTWSEKKRGNEFTDGELQVSTTVRNMLRADAQLGRLGISTLDGKNAQNRHDRLATYGGRSWSIFDTTTWQRAYDSESDSGLQFAVFADYAFNADTRQATRTPQQTMDARSRSKGSEPEVVEVGVVGGALTVFVGHERPGGISIYTIPLDGLPIRPEYQSFHYYGGQGQTWQQLYNNRVCRDLGIEDIKFLPNGPAAMGGGPMLAVSGEVSGTVSFYRVYDDGSEAVDVEAMYANMTMYERNMS